MQRKPSAGSPYPIQFWNSATQTPGDSTVCWIWQAYLTAYALFCKCFVFYIYSVPCVFFVFTIWPLVLSLSVVPFCPVGAQSRESYPANARVRMRLNKLVMNSYTPTIHSDTQRARQSTARAYFSEPGPSNSRSCPTQARLDEKPFYTGPALQRAPPKARVLPKC